MERKAMLNLVDQVLDRTYCYCEEEEDALRDVMGYLTGLEPVLWKEVSDGQMQPYGTMYAKLLVAYYLTLPEIREEWKEAIRNEVLDPFADFYYSDIGYHEGSCLTSLFLSYVDSLKIWERASYPLKIMDWSDEETLGFQIFQCIPDFVVKELVSMDELCIAEEILRFAYGIAGWNGEGLAYHVWESHRLYDVMAMERKGKTVLGERIKEHLNKLQQGIPRNNYITDGFSCQFLDDNRKSYVFCFMEGPEVTGDDAAFASELSPMMHPYQWSSLFVLKELHEDLEAYEGMIEEKDYKMQLKELSEAS